MRGNGTLLDRCHVAPQRNTCFLVLERCWSRNKLKMIVSYSHMTVVRLQAEGWTHKGEYAETCVFSEILVHLRYPLQNNCVFSEILEILEISGPLVMDILNGFKSLKTLKSLKKHSFFKMDIWEWQKSQQKHCVFCKGFLDVANIAMKIDHFSCCLSVTREGHSTWRVTGSLTVTSVHYWWTSLSTWWPTQYVVAWKHLRWAWRK